MLQNLKTVVTLGGSVDGSFNKIGSTISSSLGQATQSVKELEQEQKSLAKTIDNTKKAAIALSEIEKNQTDAVNAQAELEESRRGVNREIAKQRRALKALTEEREKQTDGESEALNDLNARYKKIEASIEDQVKVRDKLTGELKKNQHEQDKLAKKSKHLKENVKDVKSLERSYERLGDDIKSARKEAEGFSKAANLKEQLGNIASTATTAVGAVWATTTATTALMTVTNEHTAQMAGLAQSYDMSIERFNAWRGVAQQAGLDGEHIGDLIEELSNKYGEFKVLGEQSSVSDVFGALGIDSAMLDGMAAADQFEFIMERLQGVTDKQQAASLADMLFGGEGNKVATYIRNTGKSLNELLKEQRQFNLLTNDGAKGAVAYGHSFKELKTVISSAWQEVSGIVGGEMAGDIRQLGQTVSQYVRENKDEVVGTLKSLVYGAKDFAVAMYNVGSAVNQVAQFLGGWQVVGTAVASLIAGKLIVGLGSMVVTGYQAVTAIGAMKLGMAGFNAVVAANPIGLAVAAVSALIFAGIQLYQNWDAITAWFGEKLDWFKTEFPATFDVIKTIFDWSPMGLIINNWEPLSAFFSDLIGGISGIFDGFISKVSSAWETVSGLMDSMNFWSDSEQSIKQTKNINQHVTQSRALSAINDTSPARQNTTVQQSVGDIKVYAAPGQSPVEVAKAVQSQLGGHQNSALYDLPEVT